MCSRIVNLAQWRAHLLEQVHRRAEQTGDSRLADLEQELRDYPGGDERAPAAIDVVLPLQLRVDDQVLSLFSIEARVGTAADVTVEELSIETFYPADAATMRVLSGREVVR